MKNIGLYDNDLSVPRKQDISIFKIIVDTVAGSADKSYADITNALNDGLLPVVLYKTASATIGLTYAGVSSGLYIFSAIVENTVYEVTVNSSNTYALVTRELAPLDENQEIDSTYLPIASAAQLGVVKQGDNITIGSDGTISAKDTTYGDATQSASGLMSANDKKKLDGVAEQATKNTITLNGAQNANPTFYAPTGAGSEDQILVFKNGVPTWSTPEGGGGTEIVLSASQPAAQQAGSFWYQEI